MNNDSQRNTVFPVITLLMVLVGVGYVVARFKLTSLLPALAPEQETWIVQSLLIIWLISLGLWLILLVERLRRNRPTRRSARQGQTSTTRQTRESTMQGQWRQADTNSRWAGNNRDTRERIPSTERHPSLVMPVPAIEVPPHHILSRAVIPLTDWSLELLQELEWRRFEDVCRSFFDAIKLNARPLESAPDSVSSLQIWQEGSTSMNAIACTVSGEVIIQVDRVRALHTAQQRHAVQQSFFLTAGHFSVEAISTARNLNITPIDGPTLLERILKLPQKRQEMLLQLAVKGDFRSPTCPVCSRKMDLRSGDFKSFWRCTGYPECRCRLIQDGDGMLRS
ncbi:MAG: hypothetical protein ACI9ZF_001300 [Bradyrhizobium sp.]|jgi:hypothetical protein